MNTNPTMQVEKIDKTINDLAFSILHTEDLGEIHDLANKIYLDSLHNDLIIQDN